MGFRLGSEFVDDGREGEGVAAVFAEAARDRIGGIVAIGEQALGVLDRG